MMILELSLAFLLGVFAWTFAEYALHNWVGHVAKGRNAFSRQHLAHHAETDWFAATRTKAAVATPILLALFGGATALADVPRAAAFTCGFALFYVAYEVIHRRTHTHAPFGWHGRWARKHHLHHHFCSPKMNHGVTTPIWDLVFGTYERPTVIPIPPKQEKGVTWLIDPETDAIHPRYANDYRLSRRKPKPLAAASA